MTREKNSHSMSLEAFFAEKSLSPLLESQDGQGGHWLWPRYRFPFANRPDGGTYPTSGNAHFGKNKNIAMLFSRPGFGDLLSGLFAKSLKKLLSA